MSDKIHLEYLNQASPEDFTYALAEIYEHSSWIPKEALKNRPFKDVEDLHQTMMNIVKQADVDKKLTLLRAHPQLAGKEAKAGTLTQSSTEEQAAANLNALTEDEVKDITELNKQYIEKHTFPFIIAVKNHTKEGIFREFRKRISLNSDDELLNAIREVGLIARIRLAALLHNFEA